MQSIRIPYKKDDFGNSLFANVAWSNDIKSPKAIALVFHAGGLLAGTADMIPKPQIKYLAEQGFAVVVPNYRLAPQVTGKQAFADCEEAYDWAIKTLPETLRTEHGIELDGTKTVALGHSSGGTLALHMASCRPIKAVTAFYPGLFNADPTTSSHKPTSAPPFGLMPDFHPTDDDWASIKPSNLQVSEAPFPLPGTVPPPRNKWQMHVLKNGEWISIVQPDGDLAAIDPMTRLTPHWPATMIVQGEVDNVPGCNLELAQRAERALKGAGVKEVQLVVVPGEAHMFDLPPTVGTTDVGPKWQAVVRGLDWLCGHV